ncbi:helix-turn-helix domain-containing protein [Yeosuana marina]|uniref:helix-turn-helix domain-containing protein n=1 Tax=Yeosuana marina TaxID=1565536 RepID=UPI0014221864|nr:helix-turn-helix domain-containing protein [Yeosuana marina]
MYLYIKSTINSNFQRNESIYHLVPLLLIVTVAGLTYPYLSNQNLWVNYLVPTIYCVWFIYLCFSYYYLVPVFKKISQKNIKLKDIEKWLISIFIGITFVWLAYAFSSFTSYISGAVTFTFVLYILILIVVFIKNKNSIYFEKINPANRKLLDNKLIQRLDEELERCIENNELYRNPNLKLVDVSKCLDVLPYELSNYLNEIKKKNFSTLINEKRIDCAKAKILSNDKYTLESIGYDCGFNSKSTFFRSFKKYTGVTPYQFLKREY